VRRDLGRGPAMMKIAETSETMGDVGRPIKIVIFAPHRKTAFGAENEK
jgi:hypothetical protein